MQSGKGRASPKESPQKSSLRPARELKINPVERSSSSPSSNATARTPKDKSPKVTERRSPRSPICEKKRPSKLSELESQISKLQNDLKIVKDQLIVSESLKKEALEDAEDVKRQLASVTLRLEESQKQFMELDASKNATAKNQLNLDSLNSALDEIQSLKEELKVSELKASQEKESDATHVELQSLKKNLSETSLVVERMKYELEQTKESEAQAQNLVKETLLQLEAAKGTINTLRSDIINSKEANNSVASELQQSRAQLSFLESYVENLKKINVSSADVADNKKSPEAVNAEKLALELDVTKSEVECLRSAIEFLEKKINEERCSSKKEIESAAEILDQIKAESILREDQLAEELKKASAEVNELKARLMDKETELQGISEENENLNMKLEKSVLCHVDQEMEAELAKLRDDICEMKGHMMGKEVELQNVCSENETLKVGITARAAEVEAARAAEVEAMTKLGYIMEEVDKSNRKAARVTEQLESAQGVNADMEAELRRLKVQSDQWRKAAEAAASMLSPGNNGKYVERTGSMPLGGKYSPVDGRVSSPYLDDYDDDSFKKKNGNVLKKIGVLWKKPQK